MPDNTREQQKFCPHHRKYMPCQECDGLQNATPPQEKQCKCPIPQTAGSLACIRCGKPYYTSIPNTTPNKQPEAWTPELKALSEAWWNYWNYQGTPDRDLIQNWWFEKITSQRASDVRRLEGIPRVNPDDANMNYTSGQQAEIRAYNAGIDQAIALLTDNK